MCPHCRAFITDKDRVCPYCNEQVGPRAIDVRSPADVLGGLIPHERFTTVIFLLVNFGLFAASMIQPTLIAFGDKETSRILAGEWWRLATAGFFHGGLLHIGMNCWVLYDLGTQVEEVYGTSRYVVFYLLSNIGGFLLSAYWSPLTPSVGASAALMGLIGAMIALGVRSKTSMGAAIRGQYIRWAIYVLLFGLLPMFRIDNAAHIGGLITGFVIAYLAGTPRISTSPGEQIWRWAAWASVALTVYSFVKMYLSFSTQSI